MVTHSFPDLDNAALWWTGIAQYSIIGLNRTINLRTNVVILVVLKPPLVESLHLQWPVYGGWGAHVGFVSRRPAGDWPDCFPDQDRGLPGDTEVHLPREVGDGNRETVGEVYRGPCLLGSNTLGFLSGGILGIPPGRE